MEKYVAGETAGQRPLHLRADVFLDRTASVARKCCKQKYSYFSHLAVPGPYRLAVRADELWLITLMMSTIGLLTAFKWQALFPGLTDYRTLGSLPLRARQ